MIDKFEEQRLASRIRGIWAIVMLWFGFVFYLSVVDPGARWLFVVIGTLLAAGALVLIFWITRKEK